MFNRVEGATALVRKPKGFFTVCDLYVTTDDYYIKVGSSYLKIAVKFGHYWPTSNPGYKILKFRGFYHESLLK